MASVIVQRYELTDFDKILNDGFKCSLDKNVIAIVQQLAEKVGAPEYIRTPQFVRKEYNENKNNRRDNNGRHRNNNRKQSITNENWNSVQPLETTKFKKSEGVDKSIDAVRKTINKITEKTYAPLSEQLSIEFSNVNDNGTDEDKTKVANTLFKIASTNPFVSVLCARLYSELLPKFEFIRGSITTCVNDFTLSCDNIKYIDPDTDYDVFCSNNKVNKNRRAFATFIVNLYKVDVITVEEVSDMITHLGGAVSKQLNNCTCGVLEELIEIIYEVSSIKMSGIQELECWDCVTKSINDVASSKFADKSSLSNRARFRAMDVKALLSK